MALPNPPTDFADLPLHIRNVPVMSLRRVGRHDRGEPYFGKNAANRFDDPRKGFGTCYCGQHLDTAIAETVLHDEVPEKGQFKIRREDIEARYLVTFAKGADNGLLRLADLTGAHLKRLGGDNRLSAECPYDTTQQWAAAVYAHPANVDGFLFVSRQLNNKRAVAVFDRAGTKFGAATYQPLARARGLAQAKNSLGIVCIGSSTH